MVLDARPDAAAQQAQSPPRPPESARAPRLARGVELCGEYEGSGFKKAPYIARRSDGQTIQLSKLLYAVAEACDGRRTYDEIAAAASESFGRRLSPRNAKTLVEEKLNPLGIVTDNDGSQPELSKPESLLALRMRKGVLPPKMVKAMTTVFYPAFLPPVVIAAVVALGVFDWWLFVEHGVAQGVRETLLNPAVFLLMFGVVIASAFFHEVGHATGLRYGGGEPGVMGAGVYIAFPAFYTDVTDAYRLSKGGRLRTDLGGVYFNALFMLGTAAVYFATGFEPLLALILVQHIEMAHQFLPFLRLDGYYIVADAVGVPDLFTRIGPILKSMIPGRKPDPRVTALKPWVRFFVSAWVLVVVPFLLFNLLMLLVNLPRFVATGVASADKQLDTMRAAFGEGNVVSGIGGVLQLAVLVLPFAGIAYTLSMVATRIGRRSWAWSADSPAKRVVVLLGGVAATALLVSAWLPGKAYRPIQPGERGTFTDFVASSETVLVERTDTPAFTPAGTDKTPLTPAREEATDDDAREPDPAVTADPVTETVAPTSEPAESAVPSATSEPTAEPSATLSPEPTATVAP
jgi:putative peptide zinc metalloprotease protein